MAHIKERLDFTKEVQENPRLKDFLMKAIDEYLSDHRLRLPPLPVLDKSSKAITLSNNSLIKSTDYQL